MILLDTDPERGRDPHSEALDRLIALYTATNKPDEVAKWRAEQTKVPDAATMPEKK